MKRVLMTAAASAVLAAAPLVHAMGMGGGMGGGIMGGGYGGGMGGYGGNNSGAGPMRGYNQGDGDRGNVDRSRDDRGNDRSRHDTREASHDPYAVLNLSAAQRQQITQIRHQMAREERTRIDAVLSPQQRALLRRARDDRSQADEAQGDLSCGET